MKTFKLLAFLLMLNIAGYAQTKRTPIADETSIVELKSSIKVETSNDTVFKAITETFEDYLTKYTVTYKKDRKGVYIEYSIPFKSEQSAEVEKFLKSL